MFQTSLLVDSSGNMKAGENDFAASISMCAVPIFTIRVDLATPWARPIQSIVSSCIESYRIIHFFTATSTCMAKSTPYRAKNKKNYQWFL